jgi:hypothetical protein
MVGRLHGLGRFGELPFLLSAARVFEIDGLRPISDVADGVDGRSGLLVVNAELAIDDLSQKSALILTVFFDADAAAEVYRVSDETLLARLDPPGQGLPRVGCSLALIRKNPETKAF